MEQILQLFDGDRDGYLSESDLVRAVQKLGELQQPDADPCQGETQTLSASLLRCISGRCLLTLQRQPPPLPRDTRVWQGGFQICLMLPAAAPLLCE